MEIRIGEVIRARRKEINISQEIFAEAMGVSVQAVSKWETGLSYPDITFLPRIAAYFHISIDELFSNKQSAEFQGIPDDGKLRIVQFLGKTLLSKEDYSPDRKLMIEIPACAGNISVEIWGSADINGDIGGNVSAGAGFSCGNVGGNVSAGTGICCGNVRGGVSAGAGVNCGNVSGGVSAGEGVSCGNVGGGVCAECGDIHCHDIKGAVQCGGNILYERE